MVKDRWKHCGTQIVNNSQMFPNVINPANDNLVSRTSKVGKNLLQMYKNKMKFNNIKKGGVNSLVPDFPTIETPDDGIPFTLANNSEPIIFMFDDDPIIFLDKEEHRHKYEEIRNPAMIAVKWLINIINDENLTIRNANIIGYQKIVNVVSYNSDLNVPYKDSNELMLHIKNVVFPIIFQYYSIYYNGAIIVANNGENYNELIDMIRTRI